MVDQNFIDSRNIIGFNASFLKKRNFTNYEDFIFNGISPSRKIISEYKGQALKNFNQDEIDEIIYKIDIFFPFLCDILSVFYNQLVPENQLMPMRTRITDRLK